MDNGDEIPLKDAAALLGISENTLQQQCRSGVLPARKMLGQWLVSPEAVEHYRAHHLGKPGFAQPELRARVHGKDGGDVE
jgi:hypothetical protein